jgi:hypothetical protein
MIIQITPIEIEEINEFANELFIEVHTKTKTEDKVIVYYALRNSLETSSITFFETQEVITLPYKTLKSSKIIIEGEDFNQLMLDENYIISYIINLLGLEILN